MSAGLHLAGPEQTTICMGLATQNHVENGMPYDEDHRAAVIEPLLEGSPLGAIWLIGPARAPMGYVMVTFDWSIEQAGMVGWIREIFLRPSVRGRGIGTEALHAVGVALRAAGLKALHADMGGAENPQAHFWSKAGFRTTDTLHIRTDIL